MNAYMKYVLPILSLICVTVLAALHDLPQDVTAAMLGALGGGGAVHAIIGGKSNA